MALHIVRHAKAGSRPDWGQSDELRPLTAKGREQALDLVHRLSPFPIQRIVSSRYARCVQTVEPLATALGIPVEEHAALAEEADLAVTWRLLESLAGTEAVLSSHGNVIPPLLDRLHRRGLEIVADEWTCRKGSVWRIETDGAGGFARAVLASTGT